MEFSDEIRMLRNMIDEFGKRELMDVGYREFEPKGEFPDDFIRKSNELETMGLTFPEEYGGGGMNTVAASVVAERKAFYLPSWHLRWTASHGLAGYPIVTFGNDEQKQLYLPRLASGEILGCCALSEPDAGSDAAAIETRAVWDKKKRVWILNGTKTWITNADEACVGVVFARANSTRRAKRHEGITAFILESKKPGLKIPGVTVGVIPKWGLRCSHFCEMFLSDVVVSSDSLLGEVSNGFYIAMDTLNNGRINIAAQAVGIARRALHEMKEYAKMRRAFGKRLMDIDEKAKKIAWLETKVEAAWLMVLRASQAKDSGGDYRLEASQAKLFASRVAKETADFFSEFAAGVGYTLEYIAERIYQDARATVIYEGTSDVQELVIAKSFRD